MTREERRRLLGDSVIEAIHARVAEAPEPAEDDTVIAEIRRVLTRPAGRIETEPTPSPAAA